MNIQEQTPSLILQPKRAFYIFGRASIAILMLSFLSQYLRLFPNLYNIRSPFQANLLHDFLLEFNFNGESNIAIYYNVLILNVAACLLIIIAYMKSRSRDIYRIHWWALAWIVLYFSINSLAHVGQKIMILVQYNKLVSAWPAHNWTLIGLAIFIILFRRFWSHLQHPFRFLFLISAVLYLAGAWSQGIIGAENPKAFGSSMFLTISQTLQYGGATLLIYSSSLFITSFYWVLTVSMNG